MSSRYKNIYEVSSNLDTKFQNYVFIVATYTMASYFTLDSWMHNPEISLTIIIELLKNVIE